MAISEATESGLEQAVNLLKAGELVAFPTETVYGLGADASNADAVAKIFKTKGRPADHPVIVHVATSQDIKAWAKDISKEAWQLAEAFWPGPLTLILKKQEQVLDCVTGNQDSVGLRVPSHPIAHALLKAFNGGVAAPSANKFGHISPTTAEHVLADFPNQILMILDGGDSEVGLESTIVDVTTSKPRLLRPGGIPLSALQKIVPSIEFQPKQKSVQKEVSTDQMSNADQIISNGNELRVSGSLDKHYAPKVTTYLVEDISKMLQYSTENPDNYVNKVIGIIAFKTEQNKFQMFDSEKQLWAQMPMEAEAYAQQLYSTMRQLENSVDELWIEEIPQDASWLAVQDRLRRATETFTK